MARRRPWMAISLVLLASEAERSDAVAALDAATAEYTAAAREPRATRSATTSKHDACIVSVVLRSAGMTGSHPAAYLNLWSGRKVRTSTMAPPGRHLLPARSIACYALPHAARDGNGPKAAVSIGFRVACGGSPRVRHLSPPRTVQSPRP